MASEERFTVKSWTVPEDLNGLPKYAFEDGTDLQIEPVEGRRASRLSWYARVPCFIEVPFDIQRPVVDLHYGEQAIKCTVDLSFDEDGLLTGELQYRSNELGGGDGNTGTFTADAKNPPVDPV